MRYVVYSKPVPSLRLGAISSREINQVWRRVQAKLAAGFTAAIDYTWDQRGDE